LELNNSLIWWICSSTTHKETASPRGCSADNWQM